MNTNSIGGADESHPPRRRDTRLENAPTVRTRTIRAASRVNPLSRDAGDAVLSADARRLSRQGRPGLLRDSRYVSWSGRPPVAYCMNIPIKCAVLAEFGGERMWHPFAMSIDEAVALDASDRHAHWGADGAWGTDRDGANRGSALGRTEAEPQRAGRMRRDQTRIGSGDRHQNAIATRRIANAITSNHMRRPKHAATSQTLTTNSRSSVRMSRPVMGSGVCVTETPGIRSSVIWWPP